MDYTTGGGRGIYIKKKNRGEKGDLPNLLVWPLKKGTYLNKLIRIH